MENLSNRFVLRTKFLIISFKKFEKFYTLAYMLSEKSIFAKRFKD